MLRVGITPDSMSEASRKGGKSAALAGHSMSPGAWIDQAAAGEASHSCTWFLQQPRVVRCADAERNVVRYTQGNAAFQTHGSQQSAAAAAGLS